MKRLILILAAISVTACNSGGGDTSAIKAPAIDPSGAPVVPPVAPVVPVVPQGPTCADLAILGEWTHMATAQGALDVSDVLTFNADCTAHDLNCTADFTFTAPGSAPDWSQLSSTQGAFVIHDTNTRKQNNSCLGYTNPAPLNKQCSYVEVDATHFYIACDFDGLREYVKTN